MIDPNPVAPGRLPGDHPERRTLADEVHARPYEALETPERASYLAVVVGVDQRTAERAHLDDLCERHGVAAPPAATNHFSAAFPTFRLKWERHGEFSSWTVMVRGSSPLPFAEPAISQLPADWLAAIPGRTLVAAHAKLIPAPLGDVDPIEIARFFDGNVVVGAVIGDGAGYAFTDFQCHADGFSRFVLLDRNFTRRQAGRMLQRLFEIESYRMMALLALPVARRDAPRVSAIEGALTSLTSDMARADGTDELLLGHLSKLAADVESTLAASQYRYGASRAYYELVRARTQELREIRIAGTQTIDEFMARRLAPAMATCESVSRRLNGLSERVARASGLLSTRVDIARERQNQLLLASMERRAGLQLRLQETVEGLSVAAITYYVAGLIGYLAKAGSATGLPLNPDLVVGISIPCVAILTALAIRQMRRRIVDAER